MVMHNKQMQGKLRSLGLFCKNCGSTRISTALRYKKRTCQRCGFFWTWVPDNQPAQPAEGQNA